MTNPTVEGIGIDPQVYDPQQAMERLLQDIRQRIPKTMKFPKFAAVFCSPKVRRQDQWLKTKAYAIEVEKGCSKEFLHVLKVAYKGTNEFVPFQMRAKHPKAFARNIHKQTTMMADTRVILLNYIGNDMMFYLKEHILAIQ